MSGDGGGGIFAYLEGGAANTTMSFVNVTARSNTAGRSRPAIGKDGVGCVVASLATESSSIHLDVVGDVGNVVSQVMVAVGY